MFLKLLKRTISALLICALLLTQALAVTYPTQGKVTYSAILRRGASDSADPLANLPVGDALILDKPTFGSADLGRCLLSIQPARIELIGLCTDICVISNALLVKAFLPEVPVAVDAACCAGVTPESHKNALDAMRMCQIEVLNG